MLQLRNVSPIIKAWCLFIKYCVTAVCLLASTQQTCMTYTYLLLCVLMMMDRNFPKHVGSYSKNKFENSVHLVGFIIRRTHHIPIAVCTVLDSWWWAEKLSETCRVPFQKYIWELSASRWFYYKKNTPYTYCCVYSARLMMMGRETVRNM